MYRTGPDPRVNPIPALPSCGMPAADCRPKGPLFVEHAVGSAVDCLAGLESVLSDLERRLIPVLCPVGPACGKPCDPACVDPPRSPLANDIESFARRIGDATDHLRDLIERLEI